MGLQAAGSPQMRHFNMIAVAAVAAWMPWVAVGAVGADAAAPKAAAVEPAAPAADSASDKIPEASAVISPQVAKLPKPEFRKVSGWVKMAISGASNDVQCHVLQGMELLLAGWDFEAYRHFCAALEVDGECLMAHWGVAVALAQPNPEMQPERDAAVLRMAELAKRKVGTELERGYVVCLMIFYRDGAGASAEAFRNLSKQFPNDPLPAVYAAILGRNGYGFYGTPKPNQERAERMLEGWLKRQPENLIVRHTLAMIRAEAPAEVLAKGLGDVLALCGKSPEMPTYQHLLGHYEYRCGHFHEAAEVFGRAVALYDAWMKHDGVSAADCPERTISESYRCVALAAEGKFDEALTAAKVLAKVPVDPKRAGAPGTRALLWEARSLPARLLLARRHKGDAKAGLATLPKPGDPQLLPEKSDARYDYQGLVALLEGYNALDEGDLDRARKLAAALAMHGAQMAKRQRQATAQGEIADWGRAIEALQIQGTAFRGDISMAGPKADRGSAYNWYLAAAERQHPAAMLMPPAVLEPMRVRVGDYLRAVGRTEKAAETYNDVLREWPGNLRALQGLKALQGK